MTSPSRPRPVETTEGAMDKYLARQEAERAKTTKLRAQRLAAEAKSISSLSRSTNRPATRLIPLGHTRSYQDSPLHRGDDLLPVGSLFWLSLRGVSERNADDRLVFDAEQPRKVRGATEPSPNL
jgi:hypothetical protein